MQGVEEGLEQTRVRQIDARKLDEGRINSENCGGVRSSSEELGEPKENYWSCSSFHSSSLKRQTRRIRDDRDHEEVELDKKVDKEDQIEEEREVGSSEFESKCEGRLSSSKDPVRAPLSCCYPKRQCISLCPPEFA